MSFTKKAFTYISGLECADLVKVRRKYLEERSLYSLFCNLNPAKIIYYLKEISNFLVCSIKYRVFLNKFCVEKYFNCDI